MPKIKHVVFLSFKADTPQAKLDEIFADLRGLMDKIPGILDFSGGPTVSVEGLERGHTHAFVMTFADVAARDTYLPHPDHELVKAKILGVLEGGINGVTVMDWEHPE